MKEYRYKFILFFIMLFFLKLTIAQDTSFVKTMYAASYIVVPKNKTWEIKRAYISGDDAYNIKISTSCFKNTYSAGDTIRIPFYVAEMELLSGNSIKTYQLYIKETK